MAHWPTRSATGSIRSVSKSEVVARVLNGDRLECQVVSPPGEKLTLIKRRRFRDNGVDIPVYVTIRRKPPAAKVLKLLRKNEKNPAAAVDDELGLMAVLNTVSDVKRFVRHLTRSATRASSFMTLEDISDTLTGDGYHPTNTGSSGKTPMLKFFARTGGMRIEFIIRVAFCSAVASLHDARDSNRC